ncbi:dysbindin domain-containing protein 2 isoform 2-T2 [Dugong dugon]
MGYGVSLPPFPRVRLLEGCTRKRGQRGRGAGRQDCPGVGAQQVCVGRAPARVPAAGRRGRVQRVSRSADGRGRAGCGSWLGGGCVRELSGGLGGKYAGPRRQPQRSSGRGRGPLPLPHFRLPPPQRPGSQGSTVPGEPGGALPAGACRSHAPAACWSARTHRGWGAGAAGADMDPNPRATLERQQLRLRERQKFFEDILQPETEFVFPLSHLHLESQRPPIGSISSMEVNVDTLEQVELIDLGDQDGADVFLPCEEAPPTPQMSGVDDHPEELSLLVAVSDRTTSRTSSSSSDSSTNLHSPNLSDGGADTPLAQSDEDDDGGGGGAEPGACS